MILTVSAFSIGQTSTGPTFLSDVGSSLYVCLTLSATQLVVKFVNSVVTKLLEMSAAELSALRQVKLQLVPVNRLFMKLGVRLGSLVTESVTQLVRTGSTRLNVLLLTAPNSVVVGTEELQVEAFRFGRLMRNVTVARTLLLTMNGSTREMLPTRRPQTPR